MNATKKLSLSSDSDERIEYLKSLQENHWYVLRFPATSKSCGAELEVERQRREAHGEKFFDYFAPTYIPVQFGAKKISKQKRFLLYNYVFIYSSVNEIRQLRLRIPTLNFLPRKGEGPNARYPYVPDNEMMRFKWIASAYANQVPLIEASLQQLSKGDRIRITSGEFAGIEATLVSYNGSKRKDIVVRIDELLWVPLLHIESDQYELISLNENSKHLYTQLDSPKYWKGLHTAMEHALKNELTETDKTLSEEVIRRFGLLEVDTDITRSKRFCLLLLAYTALSKRKEQLLTLEEAEALLPCMNAELARALLLCTLYVCTDNYLYWELSHKMVKQWEEEGKLKRNKEQIISRLKDYDLWLGH